MNFQDYTLVQDLKKIGIRIGTVRAFCDLHLILNSSCDICPFMFNGDVPSYGCTVSHIVLTIGKVIK